MALKRAAICKGCWEQMRVPVPLRGPLSIPFRAFGVRPSRMNPNLCTICELSFTKVMRARKVNIDATILFADLRGYTGLSQSLSTDAMSGLLDAFYDECASAIWEQDGLLNKTIGDAVMAVFNFPVSHRDHVQRALQAARDIQERCRDRRARLKDTFDLTGTELGVGIGIDTGEVSFGEFGQSHRDVTAIGAVVNTASRAQSVAEAGQILVTNAVYDKVQPQLAGILPRLYLLKGFSRRSKNRSPSSSLQVTSMTATGGTIRPAFSSSRRWAVSRRPGSLSSCSTAIMTPNARSRAALFSPQTSACFRHGGRKHSC